LHHVDKIYDVLLDMGLKPFVELNPMPEALASGTTTMFYYKMNVTPPRLFEEWGMLVEKFIEHCVDRYGLVTQVGIPKVTANAFRFMSKLRGNRLEVNCIEEFPPGCGVVATKELKVVNGFVYNHLFVTKTEREAFLTDINVCVEEAGKYLITVAKLKIGAGSAKEIWESIGCPQNMTPIQEEAIRKMSEPEYSFEVIDADEYASFNLSLESNEFLYLELKPVDGVALGKSAEMDLVKLNQQLFTDDALK